MPEPRQWCCEVHAPWRTGRKVGPTIDDLKALQRRLNLLDVHVCWLGPKGFVIAHTDEERATIDLEDCELHCWLTDESEPPEEIGYYVVTPHGVDAYSESYPVARFDFTPLDPSPRGETEEWVIRICECGFPLGATLAAIALKVCPDCKRSTIPVENQTQSVTVYRPSPRPQESKQVHAERSAIAECKTCGMPVRVDFIGGELARVFAVCGHVAEPSPRPQESK